MKKLLLLYFFIFLTCIGFSQSCTHTIRLTDTFGDGWNGGRVAVSVNGIAVLTNLGLTSGYGPLNYTFTAAVGSTIRVYRTLAGTYPSEMRFQVLNSGGATLIGVTMPVAGTAGSGGTTCLGNCSAASSGCTNIYAYGSAVAPSTPTTVTISTCNYQDEYSTVSGIVAGSMYQFGYSLGGYITIHTGTYNGPIVAYGNAPLTWTSAYTGTVFVHYNTNSSCGTAMSCGISTVTCVTCSAPTPPANDLVCSATNMVCGQSMGGTTVNATNSGTGENGSCGTAQTQPGVWYVFAGNGQTVTASLCATAWDSKISVFSGPNCSSLTCVGGIDDFGPACASTSASYTWNSVIGTNYYILVHGFSTTSAFTIATTCVATVPPNPTSISTTANTICSGNGVTLTANGAVGTVCWYTAGCGIGAQVGGGNSITVYPTTTTTYYARNLTGAGFSVGCASITITVNPTPTVTITPVSNTICLGSNTQLISNVSGVSAPTYAWSPSTGLTNASAPSPYASPTSTQSYQLTVTSNGCSAITFTTITVNPSVGTVSNISGNNTIIAGTAETYSITPIGGVTYQWAYTESITAPLWINIPSSNAPTVTFTWPQTTTNGSVRVTVSNSFGCGTQTIFFNIITNGALPVELLSFDGICNDGLITLNWITASEHNSDYFDVLKSRDGINWLKLTTMNAAGNSTQEIRYSVKDENAIDGNNYYKLLQVDIDGQSKEYGPINVTCNANNKGYFSIFPNPSSGAFQVVLNNKNMIGMGNLIIKDTKGSEVFSKQIKVSAGINLFDVSIDLTPGVYHISIVSNNISTNTLKQIIH